MAEYNNQSPDYIIAFETLEKAKIYLYNLSNTFNTNCIRWHRSHEKFIVKNNVCSDKFYIQSLTVH